jgi:hypothetical protein
VRAEGQSKRQGSEVARDRVDTEEEKYSQAEKGTQIRNTNTYLRSHYAYANHRPFGQADTVSAL